MNIYLFGDGGNGNCKLVLSTNTDVPQVYPNINFNMALLVLLSPVLG